MDLKGRRAVPQGLLRRMTEALLHRGPDEAGYLEQDGIALGMRRLSIVGLADGQQPMCNEKGNIHTVFNGELFDHQQIRTGLTARGHVLVTGCDTEVIPHLYEESQEALFERLRGQFAIALWDQDRRVLTLGRDRFGIAPLYWTRQEDWLLFASEIKGLLASGIVPAEPDLRGIDHIFTFSALPGPITCFKGIQLLPPGHFLRISKDEISVRKYWEMDFPDAGDEELDEDPEALVDKFEQVLLGAVEKRLRADVPVGAYLSGGVDSSIIVALSCRLKGPAINTYTIRVDSPELDELAAANVVAKYVGTKPPIVQEFRTEDAIKTYPSLIEAAESPVIDTSCAALLQLAAKVHANGQKVVLTGEGADEWLVGYPWYKISKILSYLDCIPGLELSNLARRGFLRLSHVPQYPPEMRANVEKIIGGPNAWIDTYGVLGLSKLRFYGDAMREVMATTQPWSELGMNLDRAKKWHPLNRGIWVAGRVTLAGHLLQAKGDRVAMHNSVEVRYPFLDEDVFDFCSKLHPTWKLHGFRDKHLLRLLAERWLPEEIYKRGKVIFRAPLDSFHVGPSPEIDEMLSESALKKSGYFDPKEVVRWRKEYLSLRPGSVPRLSIEMGLAAVVATQMWHQRFIENKMPLH